MYLCMSLGFRASYRLSPRGPGELDRMREETLRRHRRASGRRPNPSCRRTGKGVDAPYRPARVVVPLWVAARRRAGVDRRAVPLVLDRPQRRLRRPSSPACTARRRRTCRRSPARRAEPAVPPPPPPEPAALDQLCEFLQAGDRPGLVDGARHAGACRSCASATAACSPRAAPPSTPSFMPLLDRIGAALKDETGPVQVDRLHRQPADPHRAVPLEFPAVAGARARRRARSSCARSAIPVAVDRRGQGGRRSDRAQRHAGGPRTEPAHRESCCGRQG